MGTELAILDAFTHEVGAQSHSVASLERRLLAPARSVGFELQVLGVTRPPRRSDATLVRDASGGYWYLATPFQDPTRQRGRIPIPRDQLDSMTRMLDGGVELDYVFLAHELPKDWQPEQELPQLVPLAPRVDLAERVVERTVSSMVRWLKGVGIVLGGATLALGAVALAPVGLAGLDPVVIGGVASDDGESVAWAVLAAWTWES